MRSGNEASISRASSPFISFTIFQNSSVSAVSELKKLSHNGMDIMAVHLKPSYREEIIEQLNALNIPKLRVMEPGRVYEW